MGSSKYAILITLYSILVKSQKHYVVPSVDATLMLLNKFHKITIQRRWFFYCMRYLQDEGHIITRHRFDHYDSSKIMQLPSMITFTLKCARYLMKNRVVGAKELMKRILKWLGRDDKRFPKPQEIDFQMSDKDAEANRARLKELLALIE